MKYFFLVLFWAGVILLLSLSPGNTIERLPLIPVPYFDKIAHWAMYLIFMVLWLNAFWHQHQRLRWWHVVVSGVVSIVYGGIMEVGQSSISTGRAQEMADFWANTAGVVCGTPVFWGWRYVRKRLI